MAENSDSLFGHSALMFDGFPGYRTYMGPPPTTDWAKPYVRRQDGWALLRHDVPAVMVTTAYGDIARMERYFDSDYHRPTDVSKPSIELGGAADDVAFLVTLGRTFSDPKRYPSPAAK